MCNFKIDIRLFDYFLHLITSSSVTSLIHRHTRIRARIYAHALIRTQPNKHKHKYKK